MIDQRELVDILACTTFLKRNRNLGVTVGEHPQLIQFVVHHAKDAKFQSARLGSYTGSIHRSCIGIFVSLDSTWHSVERIFGPGMVGLPNVAVRRSCSAYIIATPRLVGFASSTTTAFSLLYNPSPVHSHRECSSNIIECLRSPPTPTSTFCSTQT